MIVFALAGLLADVPAGAAAGLVRIPVIGCPGDGQQGPQPAPPGGVRTMRLTLQAAARLAVYASEGQSILAPRGWQCLALSGSNGDTLVVAPHRLDSGQLSTGRLDGPAVQLSRAFADTSGRFEVAAVAARLFPTAHSFVARVEAESIAPRAARGPFPHDRIVGRSARRVRSITLAGARGFGTEGLLAPADRPIDSLAVLLPGDDLLTLRVRLSEADRPLSKVIIDQADGAAR